MTAPPRPLASAAVTPSRMLVVIGFINQDSRNAERAFCGSRTISRVNAVSLAKVDRFQNDISWIFRAALADIAAPFRSYNFACLGYWERLNFFERWNFMTEPDNRVLTRTGARILTEAEMAKIGGAFSTGGIITD